jgi:hypothetical protein
VSAGNRNAPLTADGSYTIFGIPGNLGSIRARATCSDGSVGESAAGFTDPFQAAVIELGPIVFGAITPVPVALLLVAPSRRINSGETSQFTTTAIGPTGQQTNVTPRSQGTTYTISNELLATVSENGLVRVFAEFAAGSSSRVLTSVTNEGSVSACAAEILSAYLPDRAAAFRHMAIEAANSRLYGGIHFRFDNEAGAKIGKQVAAEVLRRYRANLKSILIRAKARRSKRTKTLRFIAQGN